MAIVSISEVDDHESKALVKSGFIQDPSQPIQLIPFRWSAETLEIVVDPNLGHEFRETLGCDLGKRIAGNIHFPERSQLTESRDSQDIWFRLGINRNGGIDIFGPEQLVGDRGPVRGWTAKGKTDEDRARESAIALAHLFRFGQILHLRNKSENPARFEATANQADATDVQKVDYEFQNLDGEELYFAVLILSPGFHVKQLFPNTGTLQEVPPSGRRSLKFRLTVPKELGGKEAHGPQHKYRDIIRTVVTKGKNLSLRSMELPDIWNADQVDKVRSSAYGRDADLLESDFGWWIQDDEMPTK
ncbi:Metacaspase-8 [Apiospora sp. TS-2023a]